MNKLDERPLEIKDRVRWSAAIVRSVRMIDRPKKAMTRGTIEDVGIDTACVLWDGMPSPTVIALNLLERAIDV